MDSARAVPARARRDAAPSALAAPQRRVLWPQPLTRRCVVRSYCVARSRTLCALMAATTMRAPAAQDFVERAHHFPVLPLDLFTPRADEMLLALLSAGKMPANPAEAAQDGEWVNRICIAHEGAVSQRPPGWTSEHIASRGVPGGAVPFNAGFPNAAPQFGSVRAGRACRHAFARHLTCCLLRTRRWTRLHGAHFARICAPAAMP